MNTPPKKISLRVLDGQTEFAEDELQKLSNFANAVSKPLFYVALVAAAGYFGFNFYQDAEIKKQKTGAEQLGIVQETFDEFTRSVVAARSATGEEKAKSEKALTELQGHLKEQIKTLADRPEPYKSLSATYEKLISVVPEGRDMQDLRTELLNHLSEKKN